MTDMYICHNCAGEIVGLIHGDFLYSASGDCIGQFNAEKELYNCEKHYIGELTTIYVDAKTLKTAMVEKELLNIEKDSTIYPVERVLVDLAKKGKRDNSTKCTQASGKFSTELYETTRLVNVPVGYEDFEI